MARLAVLDAPIDSSGSGRAEENAPRALRAAGVVERLGAVDAGEAEARIRDSRREPESGVIGADEVRAASAAIAASVRAVLRAGQLPLVLGGDCTLLLGVFDALDAGSGMWFVDGHADFFDGWSSPTGEAADMELAILTGHGPHGPLDRRPPPLEPSAVVLLGHRPSALHPDVAEENARIDSAIEALTALDVVERGPARVGADAAARLAERPAWLHLDLDVLDEATLPAVSYPQPLGLDWDQLTELARPLAAAANLVGVSIADFNPDLDRDGEHAAHIVDAIASLEFRD
jgi:arginase